MRIGCLQFAPQVGDVDNNLNRADSVLTRTNPEDLDVLVLPEMAFSGYNFKTLQQISPFLEPSASGITSLWARTTALKYNCVVAVGYPEKVDPSPKWPTGPEYYNSVIVVNADGETVANYRKSFLYYTDETWALEGDKGFYEGFLPGLGQTAMGICMDLNPYKFQAPWSAFEFAHHVLEVRANLVIVSMAWMTREDAGIFSQMPNEPDMDTLSYWVTRLEPLIRAETTEEIIVVFCNRTGVEDEAVYAGTSAVVGIQDGEVKVYGLVGRGEKELLIVDTDQPPIAKLVYRPESATSVPTEGSLRNTSQVNLTTMSNTSSTARESEHTPTSSKENIAVSGKDAELPLRSSAPQLPSQRKPSPNRHRPSPVQIPPQLPELDSRDTNCPSATSQKSFGSVGVLTPSAPSPTPQAIRPKLIIPQSPPLLPMLPLSSQPQSSTSTRSFQSLQSVESYQSTLSNQSVKSNGRPPAESTPYPDSGLPLSGYPRPAPDRTYTGAQLLGRRSDSRFSPITPFDDTPPSSARFAWSSPHDFQGSPIDGWTPIEARVGRGRSFQYWPDPIKRAPSTGSVRSTTTTTALDVSSKETGVPDEPAQSTDGAGSITASFASDFTPVAEGRDASWETTPNIQRPQSRASGQTSRSRTWTSDTLGSHRSVSGDRTGHSRSLSRTSELRNTRRNESPIPDRPHSPKLRNCSRPPSEETVSSSSNDAKLVVFPERRSRSTSATSHSDVHVTSQDRQRSLSRSRFHTQVNSTSEIDVTLVGGPNTTNFQARKKSPDINSSDGIILKDDVFSDTPPRSHSAAPSVKHVAQHDGSRNIAYGGIEHLKAAKSSFTTSSPIPGDQSKSKTYSTTNGSDHFAPSTGSGRDANSRQNGYHGSSTGTPGQQATYEESWNYDAWQPYSSTYTSSSSPNFNPSTPKPMTLACHGEIPGEDSTLLTAVEQTAPAVTDRGGEAVSNYW